MARNIRWQITFKSLNGTTCRVDIYDNDWPAGVVMPVRGAADPFYYEEDNSDDLLNGVLRYRTGYIRVVENYYGQLDDIRPESTFDRYVEFLYGGVVMFNGYIQVQDFSHTLEFSTQQDPCQHVVEFPVISPMGLFDKRTFPYIMPPTTKTIGQLLDMILAGSTYQKVTLPNITSVGFWQTIYSLVVCPWDKDYHHSMTYDAIHKVMRPQSYAYLIEGICKAFGWICHDTPQALVFTMFDYEGLYCYYPVGHIGDANYKQTESIGTTAVALTDYYSLADDNARVDTLLPDTGIEINYEGDLGKVDFSFQRTRYYDVIIPPGWIGDPDELFSLCNLFPVGQLFEISNVSPAYFTNQGNIQYGNSVVAWNGHVGVLSSISDSHQDGHLLCTIRLYVKRHTGCTWGVTFDGMASSDGEGNYNSSLGALKDDDKITNYYVQTQRTVYDDYVEVAFTYHYSDAEGSEYPHLPNYTLIFIHNIKFNIVEHDEPYAEYRFKPANKSDVIPADTYPEVSSSVTMPISLYRLNTNMIGETVMAQKLTEYPYLFQKRLVLNGKFRPATAQAPELFHARMWSYLSRKWRLIAQTFHPWDDEYELTLQNSIVLDAIRHSITGTGEHTSIDGYSDNVYDGTPFSHLLTPSTGYSITSVVITMGGIDITSTAYDSTTGQISIASVTGDVAITAVAETVYDSQVEWLQSDGTAYIDTGIKPFNKANGTHVMKIEIEIVTLDGFRGNTAIFGSRISNNNTQFTLQFYIDQTGTGNNCWRWAFGNTSKQPTHNKTNGTFALYNSISGSDMVMNITGQHSITSGITNVDVENDYPIFLFAQNSGGSVAGRSNSQYLRIKWCKLYDGMTLLRDFIAVRKNGVGYMYDRVSGQRFGNADVSGAFTYGNDVN